MGIWIRELGAGQVLTESKVFDVISTIHQDWFPHLLQESVLVVVATAHLRVKCWSRWGVGRAPFTHRPPVVIVPIPCLWTPSLARWPLGRSKPPAGFLQSGGEGQRCQPPGPSPSFLPPSF